MEEKKRVRLLSYRDLRYEKGFDYTPEHIRRLVAQGRFPKPVKLADGPWSKVGFLEHEVDEFIERRAALRGAPAA